MNETTEKRSELLFSEIHSCESFNLKWQNKQKDRYQRKEACDNLPSSLSVANYFR